MPSVILQPTVFMDNLRAPWSLPGIVGEGVLAYPAPEDARISWLSHKSLADFVVAAAALRDDASYDLRIGGPEALTGIELAAILSEALARPITYARIPLDAFAAGMNRAIGAPAGDRLASFYRGVEARPDWLAVGSAEQFPLHVEPESVAQFVARHDWLPPEA